MSTRNLIYAVVRHFVLFIVNVRCIRLINRRWLTCCTRVP